MPDMGIQPPYLDPSQYPAYLDLQKKQMLAQALGQAAQQTSQTPAEWNSMRVVPKKSALSTVAALATALGAGKMQHDAFGAQQQYMRGLFGGQPGPAPSAAASPKSGVAPLTSEMPPQSGVMASQPQAPPSAGNQNMLLTGDPKTSQALLSMMGPQEYAKALAGRYAPTDMEKMLRAAGIDPSSAQGQQALVQNVNKQNYIAPVQAREASTLVGPDGKPIFYNPKVAAGAMPQFGANGQPVAVTQIPGAEAAETASSAGHTAGAVSQTPLKVGVDAQGKDVYEFPQPPALAMEGTVSGARMLGRQPPKVAQPPSTGGIPASKAVLSAQEEGGKTGQQYSNELAKNATGATEVRRGLSELSNLAQLATPNAANTRRAQVGAFLVAAGVNPKTASSMVGSDIGAIDAAAHQSGSLAVGSIHSMTSRGTNFDLDTFMKQNPNLDMGTPEGFSRVVQYMDGKAQQEVAKNADFVDWKRTHKTNPEDWESEHTAHWLTRQNQMIDKGKFNSQPTAVSKTGAVPVSKQIGGKTYVQQNGKWFEQ